MNAHLLRGCDHSALGSIGEVDGGCAALAISRGGALKTYSHTDANEDAALFVAGARGTLVAVADGHAGTEAAELALVRLSDCYASPWVEGPNYERERWYHEIIGALVDVNQAILEIQTEARPSRTTVSLALVRCDDDLLLTASVGDSHIFRVAAGVATDFGWPRDRRNFFLGQLPLTATGLAREARIEIAPLGDAVAVAAVTDGFSERNIGVLDPVAAVVSTANAIASESPARRSGAMARGLVAAALDAHKERGAGDNIAAAVAWFGRDPVASETAQ